MVSDTSRLSASTTSRTLPGRTSVRTAWAPPKLHPDRAALAVANQLQLDLLAGAHRADLVGQVVPARERAPVHRHDHVPAGAHARGLELDLVVARAQLGVLRRAVGLDLLHQRAVSHVQA